MSGLTELTQLTCGNSQLTSLDLSDCSSLISLACGNNQLTSLDVSGFTALEFLYGQHNQLTSLDLSGCSALKHLDCADNRLVSLDISDCTGLTSLYNFFNPGRSGQFLISAWFSWNPANGAGSFPAQLSEAVTGLNVDWPYYGSGTVSARFVNVRP